MRRVLTLGRPGWLACWRAASWALLLLRCYGIVTIDSSQPIPQPPFPPLKSPTGYAVPSPAAPGPHTRRAAAAGVRACLLACLLLYQRRSDLGTSQITRSGLGSSPETRSAIRPGMMKDGTATEDGGRGGEEGSKAKWDRERAAKAYLDDLACYAPGCGQRVLFLGSRFGLFFLGSLSPATAAILPCLISCSAVACVCHVDLRRRVDPIVVGTVYNTYWTDTRREGEGCVGCRTVRPGAQRFVSCHG